VSVPSVCVCMHACVNLHMVGLETRCRLPTCWYFSCVVFQPVFSMADACSVANNSPLARDCVVDTSSGQGSSQVGVAIPPVRQKAYKWCKAFCVCV